MWVGDVGQDSWEEINLIKKGGNYGWRCRERALELTTGNTCTSSEGPYEDPALAYSHNEGASVTGGYVYHGTEIAGLTKRLSVSQTGQMEKYGE